MSLYSRLGVEPYQPETSWIIYIQRLKNKFQLNEVSPEKRVLILLDIIGASNYERLLELCERPESRTFDELVLLLNSFLDVKRNKYEERVKFSKCMQASSESVKDFSIRLSEISRCCMFPENWLQEALITQFIIGLHKEKSRQKVLSQGHITDFKTIVQFVYETSKEPIFQPSTESAASRFNEIEIRTDNRESETLVPELSNHSPLKTDAPVEEDGEWAVAEPEVSLTEHDTYFVKVEPADEYTEIGENRADLSQANEIGMGEKGVVKCRTCNGDHWTLKCPFKDMNISGGKPIEEKKPLVPAVDDKKPAAKYVPPLLRDGGNKSGTSMKNIIRVSNLSESTQDADLEDLVKPFGPISKLYLVKDKKTGLCKGYAYIQFKMRSDAAKAIKALNGHGYDYLILSVDWCKLQATT